MISSTDATDLVIACTFYIKERRLFYINYMEHADSLFKYFVRDDHSLRGYCDETYPDICVCGNIITDAGSCLRNHCHICKGRSGHSLGYDINQICNLVHISHSWAEFGIANGVRYVRGRKH